MSKASSQQTMQYSDSEMEDLRQQVLKKRSLAFVDDDQLNSLYIYLRGLKAQYLEEGKYLDARDANELMEGCKDEQQYRHDEQHPNKNEDSFENTTAGKKKSEFNKKIQEHDEQTKQKIQALRDKQAQELEKFETDWRDVMPEKYRRPSKRLIDLRQTAKNLAYSGKFEEANERQIEAQKMMEAEHEQAKLRLDHDYDDAKKKLLKKHNDDLANLQETCNQQRELLKSKMKATEQALENRMTVLGTKPTTKTRGSASKLQESPPPPQLQNRGTRKSNTMETDQRLPPLAPPNGGGGGSTTQRKKTNVKPLNQPQAKSPPPKSPQQTKQKSSEQKQQSPPPEEKKPDPENAKTEEGVLEEKIESQANQLLDGVNEVKE